MVASKPRCMPSATQKDNLVCHLIFHLSPFAFHLCLLVAASVQWAWQGNREVLVLMMIPKPILYSNLIKVPFGLVSVLSTTAGARARETQVHDVALHA
ncbi:uncharacterized protein B0I36DRAFT_309834 [Microdochium trichocladiopsis]|uniref:Uncharacterized protein n=1 Tax=Microdochium trichocladiopsis TaxID=1682393 RepID=A0A9P8YHF0_9PEZI|nr:uncharacterized protein B0I36DRAFT_309834 [Microdochium trichocladiopsis]KAH7040057.1 hypothetical protein B0I36DRAFT_309834 [Microdochium trichocladiopsis]